MNDLQRQILLAAALPATLVVITFVVLYRPWRRDFAGGKSAASSGASFGIGLSIALLILLGLPQSIPAEPVAWLLPLGLLAAIVGIASAFLSGRAARSIPLIVMAVCSALVLVPPFQQPRWLWMLALGATILSIGFVLNYVSARSAAPTVPLAVLLTSAAAAVVLFCASISILSNCLIALFAMTIPVLALSLWRPRISLSPSATPLAAMLIPGALFNAHFNNYSDVPVVVFYLNAFAPLAILLATIPPLRRRPWIGTIVACAAVAIPLIIAVVMAIRALPANSMD